MLYLALGVIFGALLGYLGGIIGTWQYEANKAYSWFVYVVDFCVVLFIITIVFLACLVFRYRKWL